MMATFTLNSIPVSTNKRLGMIGPEQIAKSTLVCMLVDGFMYVGVVLETNGWD